MGPGGRSEFTSHENVQAKLGGLLLLVEGTHQREGATVHDALAVVSFDEKSRTYRFRAHTAAGQYTDADARLAEDGALEWSFNTPMGRIRYTIRGADKGEWREIGEFSRDGGEWRKFFEMNLKRVR